MTYVAHFFSIAFAFLLTSPAATKTMVVDGDTLKVDGESFRLTIDGSDSFDTPEIYRAGCLAERLLGERAADRLRELLSSGYEVRELGENDRYGRGLWAVSVNGENVGKVLIREGLAVPLYGCPKCRRVAPRWCE